jgi:hypothetical protein
VGWPISAMPPGMPGMPGMHRWSLSRRRGSKISPRRSSKSTESTPTAGDTRSQSPELKIAATSFSEPPSASAAIRAASRIA